MAAFPLVLYVRIKGRSVRKVNEICRWWVKEVRESAVGKSLGLYIGQNGETMHLFYIGGCRIVNDEHS